MFYQSLAVSRFVIATPKCRRNGTGRLFDGGCSRNSLGLSSSVFLLYQQIQRKQIERTKSIKQDMPFSGLPAADLQRPFLPTQI
jgi:hypothetical protein